MHHLVVVPSDRAARILTLMVAITCNPYTTVYQMIKIELQGKQQAEMDAFKEKKHCLYLSKVQPFSNIGFIPVYNLY